MVSDLGRAPTFNGGVSQGIALMMKQNLSSSSFWISDLTVGMAGRCYTLNYSQAIGSDIEDDTLSFNLDPKLTYRYFIHQPHFFLQTWNPLTMPMPMGILKYKELGDNWLFLYLKVIRQEKLDREDERCNPEPGYSFMACVKERLSREVGCRLPWDTHTRGGI